MIETVKKNRKSAFRRLMSQNNANIISRGIGSFILKGIAFYRFFISKDHGIFKKSGRVCRFFPSCSEYSETAFRKYGLLKASFFSFKRIIRCHPFQKGGYDPI